MAAHLEKRERVRQEAPAVEHGYQHLC
jgi:hypothetical protein